MSLYTGKEIHSDDGMELHIDDVVVKKLEELAKK